jgi:hypothetical protein
LTTCAEYGNGKADQGKKKGKFEDNQTKINKDKAK